MKSRTLIEVSQSPGRKSFQQSPASASFLRAALAFMVRLPPAYGWLLLAPPVDPDRRSWCAGQTNHSRANSSAFDLSQRNEAGQLSRPPLIIDLAQYTVTAAPMDWRQRGEVDD